MFLLLCTPDPMLRFVFYFILCITFYDFHTIKFQNPKIYRFMRSLNHILCIDFFQRIFFIQFFAAFSFKQFLFTDYTILTVENISTIEVHFFICDFVQ